MKNRLIEYWERSGLIKDNNVLKAFKEVPREEFVLDELIREAYSDYPLPIGAGQTISQPSTIMIMLHALELKKSDKVLEIGTGSGYNAALIAKIAKFVYTTEVVPELIKLAENNIKKQKIKNIKIIHTDGSKGYSKEAPYDKIIATAACPYIPKPWIEQLKDNGIIVAPVGSLYGQKMIKAKKIKEKLEQEELGEFMFVPLKGKYGFP